MRGSIDEVVGTRPSLRPVPEVSPPSGEGRNWSGGQWTRPPRRPRWSKLDGAARGRCSDDQILVE
jgi:hypothetical protein